MYWLYCSYKFLKGGSWKGGLSISMGGGWKNIKGPQPPSAPTFLRPCFWIILSVWLADSFSRQGHYTWVFIFGAVRGFVIEPETTFDLSVETTQIRIHKQQLVEIADLPPQFRYRIKPNRVSNPQFVFHALVGNNKYGTKMRKLNNSYS